MKQWISKLISQLEDVTFEKQNKSEPTIAEDRATLIYILDVYNKNLFEVEKHSVRKVREKLDQFAKALLDSDPQKLEKTLFEIRQFFSSYRIDEYSYIQNTFDDFKRIVWDFADQLSEDVEFEKDKDQKLSVHLQDLKESVDANSIESLRVKSREFINSYMEYQSQKNEKRQKRMNSVKKNLDLMKKQLVTAQNSLYIDHLTSAHNRKSCDEYLKKLVQANHLSPNAVTLIALDIDHFKKINDSYGHDIGDYVLKECVGLLKEQFSQDGEMVARMGGEEFAIILPDHTIDTAVPRIEAAMKKIRDEKFIQGDLEIRFTVSMGVSQLLEGETVGEWLKRADQALYHSKNTGRNKYTIAGAQHKPARVA